MGPTSGPTKMISRSERSAVRTSPPRSAPLLVRPSTLSGIRNGACICAIDRSRAAASSSIQLLKTNALNAADKAKLANLDIVINSAALEMSFARNGSYLLSQAFPKGSPTHPAYPTGHGTVAGACITVLKFFFDGNATFTYRVAPSNDGLSLVPYNGPGPLTVNGELHKLAHNVSFGHGIHAGIHWRSDTDYSILLGEQVAIDFLTDQMYTYQEDFDIAITKIDGSQRHFKNF